MRTCNLLAGLVALFLLAGAADAVTFPLYLQDDFKFTFGAPGNPGAPGGYLLVTGAILTPDSVWVADFRYAGSNSQSYQVDDEVWTDFGVSITIGVSNGGGGFSTTFWTGTGHVTTRVKVGGGPFPPEQLRYPSAGYWHPSDQPQFYQGMGSGAITGTGSGAWAGVEELYIPWFGTYNWRYDDSLTWQKGNMQGMLMDAPEPSSLPVQVDCGLALSGPVPNPGVGAGARLILSLPEAITVHASVFDVAGQRVQVLRSGDLLDAGSHEIAWDGRTGDGRVAGAGVYWIRVSAGENLLTRQVTVVQ